MLEMKNIKKIYRTELIETHALEDFGKGGVETSRRCCRPN